MDPRSSSLLWVGSIPLLVIALLVGMLGGGPAVAGALPPEILEAGDPAWSDLRTLELAGDVPVGATSIRPVTREEVARWIVAASSAEPRCIGALTRLRRAFAREIRRLGVPIDVRETRPLIRLTGVGEEGGALDGARDELRIGTRFGFHLRATDEEVIVADSTRAGLYGRLLLGRSVALQGEIFIGEIKGGRRIGDPLIADTDILYFAEEVGAAFAHRDLRIRVARGRHHWGPGPGPSLLLNGSAAPISFAEWDLRMPGGLRFRSLTGSLGVLEERGIAAHRLEVPITPDLHLAIAEGVRYQGGIAHPLYLLGLLPYTLVQRLDEQDTSADSVRSENRNNILATAEAVWRPRPGMLIYGEVLVDDIPAERADSPARLGGRIGIGLLRPVGGTPVEIWFEAGKVGRYVYAVDYDSGCSCDWIHQDQALGDPRGPDQESIRLRAARSIGGDHRLEVALQLDNLGGGALGEAWSGLEEDLSEPTRRALTVSPPVTRRREIGLVWRYEPRDNLSLEVGGGVVWKRVGEGGPRETDLRIETRSNWRL